ncbi:MAG: hypothetical protein MK186_13850 [Henriciella sp.]|nr:hypothetical protein [Henriciella sp.]
MFSISGDILRLTISFLVAFLFVPLSANASNLPVDIDVAFQDCAGLWIMTLKVAEEAGHDKATITARQNAETIISIYEQLIESESRDILEPVFDRFRRHLADNPSGFSEISDRYTPACDAVTGFLDMLKQNSEAQS